MISLLTRQEMADSLEFHRRSPHLLVMDNFYKDPDKIREHALSLTYSENIKFYKGMRSNKQLLLPYVREEFMRLLHVDIVDWLNQNANGIFQKTKDADPLVYHSDSQDYAAAIYLTPDMPVSMGTSFWRSIRTGCRRPPNHPLENRDIPASDVYNPDTILNSEAWELVDRVGSVYNRLVIWDAKLIHSASQYGAMDRLVQLFFFNVKK